RGRRRRNRLARPPRQPRHRTWPGRDGRARRRTRRRLLRRRPRPRYLRGGRAAPGGGLVTATRILVADDHPTFRRGLRALIDSLPGIELIGEAADGEAAVAQAAELLPDVVVMDLNMPGLNGVEATRQIVTAHPGIVVLVLTMLD